MRFRNNISKAYGVTDGSSSALFIVVFVSLPPDIRCHSLSLPSEIIKMASPSAMLKDNFGLRGVFSIDFRRVEGFP